MFEVQTQWLGEREGPRRSIEAKPQQLYTGGERRERRGSLRVCIRTIAAGCVYHRQAWECRAIEPREEGVWSSCDTCICHQECSSSTHRLLGREWVRSGKEEDPSLRVGEKGQR
ncbi:hypothetical protein B296_00001165 [Ensete ventricosum]|uniref:Uncharacterized protein n=1 Tax=Ensete ventricosum TaxID=4639 RepID=A0A426YWV1_ENSVE|nr:hypothetical protein B296_00001165 [Ensete ventricosum]